IISNLLILGGDQVHKALANVAGTELAHFNVPFSFGWLAQAVSAIGPVVAGQRNILPKPDVDSLVMNMGSGQSRKNQSFLLSRLLRDLEKRAGPAIGSLQITVLESTGQLPNHGSAMPENVGEISSQYLAHRAGMIATCLQFAIAISTSEAVSFITVAATALAFLTSNLDAWKASKYIGRRNGDETYALMRGNGHRHIFLIKNTSANALNLEDLAASSVTKYNWFGSSDGYIVVFSALAWLALAIYACTLDKGIGGLIAIMAIGTVANILTASAARSPAAHGIPLVQKSTHSGEKVMTVLQELEDQEPGYGQHLLKTFFSGPLRDNDSKWWADKKEA
ncbi:hypothetical protein BDV96DRAFT_472140, partial [Lophiotrema nucula]